MSINHNKIIGKTPNHLPHPESQPHEHTPHEEHEWYDRHPHLRPHLHGDTSNVTVLGEGDQLFNTGELRGVDAAIFGNFIVEMDYPSDEGEVSIPGHLLELQQQ